MSNSLVNRLEGGSLVFLKLGGSLITDKARPRTLRADVLRRLVAEITQALASDPDLHILLGHGSGSFGHVPARKWGTRQGVHSAEEWGGFVEVYREADLLNRLVMDALADQDLPAIAISAHSAVLAEEGRVVAWDTALIQDALQERLLPVVYGDVVFDRAIGGTILSTEDLFAHLASRLRPTRILLAGIEPGVWADYPACTELVPAITTASISSVLATLEGSAATDVTGGMASKVLENLELVKLNPNLEVVIFSGLQAGNLEKVLAGATLGTVIRAV